MRITADVEDFELPYVAGIVDGEGCISIHKNTAKAYGYRPRISLQVSIANTNKQLLEKLARQFGGGSVHSHQAKKYNKNAKESYRWVIVERKGTEFLQKIYPWLFIKRKQAEVAFLLAGAKAKYRKNKAGRGHGNRLTDREYKEREKLWRIGKKLNARGAASENHS